MIINWLESGLVTQFGSGFRLSSKAVVVILFNRDCFAQSEGVVECRCLTPGM